MTIPICPAFARQLIKQRWGSVDELAAGWAERCDERRQRIGSPRDRGTIYRWLSQGLPNRRADVFGLCGALDIDPIVLLDIEEPRFERIFAHERLLFLINAASRSRMSALWPLVRPALHWPDPAIGYDFYARSWTTFDFVHAAAAHRNVYAQLRLFAEPHECDESAHRLYYFAYRRCGARDGLWRPYGVVRKRGTEAICLAENGDAHRDPERLPRRLSTVDSGGIDVETFFGPGPAEFRVACLHEFAAELYVPSSASRALRFEG